MIKRLVVFIFIITCVMSLSTIAFAATEKDVLDFIKAPHEVNGVERRVQPSDIVRAERFFETHKYTAAEYDQILAKLKEILEIMRTEGKIDPALMSAEGKNKLMAAIQEIADITGTVINYAKTSDNRGYLIVYDEDGNKIDEINFTKDSFKATGSSNTLFLYGGLLFIGIFTFLKYKKRESRSIN